LVSEVTTLVTLLYGIIRSCEVFPPVLETNKDNSLHCFSGVNWVMWSVVLLMSC